MDELKELRSVLKRIWEELEDEQKIKFELVEKILKAEADSQEDSQRAKQATTMLIEEYLNQEAP